MISIAALASALSFSTPVWAQDDADLREELAAMRAAMAEMAARIDTLEDELEEAEAKADAANQTKEAQHHKERV